MPRQATCLVTVLLVQPFAGVYGLGGLPCATTASADFSQTLVGEISPGKVLKLSARAAKLYLMCLSVTFGFRIS